MTDKELLNNLYIIRILIDDWNDESTLIYRSIVTELLSRIDVEL